MTKIKIVLDEDKIRAEGEYEVEEIKRCVCSPFEKKGLYKIETIDGSIIYSDRDRDDEHAKLIIANVTLTDAEWFARYVKSWSCTYDDDDGDPENVLKTVREMRVGAFA